MKKIEEGRMEFMRHIAGYSLLHLFLLLVPFLLLSTQFSNNLSLCSSLKVKDRWF
jgi:hypothetical protein